MALMTPRRVGGGTTPNPARAEVWYLDSGSAASSPCNGELGRAQNYRWVRSRARESRPRQDEVQCARRESAERLASR